MQGLDDPTRQDINSSKKEAFLNQRKNSVLNIRISHYQDKKGPSTINHYIANDFLILFASRLVSVSLVTPTSNTRRPTICFIGAQFFIKYLKNASF